MDPDDIKDLSEWEGCGCLVFAFLAFGLLVTALWYLGA